MRTCEHCNTEYTKTREDYEDDLTGLDPAVYKVVLENIEVHHCKCGLSPTYFAMSSFLVGLGILLCESTKKLEWSSVKYLRKSLRLKPFGFAEFLGVAPATIDQWESKDGEAISAEDSIRVRKKVLPLLNIRWSEGIIEPYWKIYNAGTKELI